MIRNMHDRYFLGSHSTKLNRVSEEQFLAEEAKLIVCTEEILEQELAWEGEAVED